MNSYKKLLDRLGRKITVLVIAHTELKPWRVQFSAAFLLFCLGLWSGVTIWAGYLAGRHVDYWITKADNKVMSAKVSYLAGEIDKAREMLDEVKVTDKQLRVLLSMSSRRQSPKASSSSLKTVGCSSFGSKLIFLIRKSQAQAMASVLK